MRKAYMVALMAMLMLSATVSAADWQMDKREAEQLKFQEKYQHMQEIRINRQIVWELQMKIKQVEYANKVYQMQQDKIKTLQRKQFGSYYFENKNYGRYASLKNNKR